jgi:hypothetical protein
MNFEYWKKKVNAMLNFSLIFLSNMKSKKILLSILMLSANIAIANMGSPEPYGGALGGRPFVNKYVDIRNEKLNITIDQQFDYAAIDAIYYIESQMDGIKIPLLFYASEYEKNFNVTVDGKKVEVMPIPDDYYIVEGTKFNDFAKAFRQYKHGGVPKDEALIKISPEEAIYSQLNEFKYFETDIPKGKHVIEVTYEAHKWIDRTNYLNEYSIRYDLSPAKQWRSYAQLELTINNLGYRGNIKTNIGKPYYGSLDSTAKWKINEIPDDIILVTTKPHIAWWIRIVLFLDPLGIWIILILFILFLHYKLIKYLYIHKLQKKYKWLMFPAIAFIPVIVFLALIYYDKFALSLLGEHAGSNFFNDNLIIFGSIYHYLLTLIVYIFLYLIMINRLGEAS